MKAYSYIRFSTPGQIAGDSLRRQLALTRQWCEARGVELVEDYRDLGVSAFRRKNAVQGKLAEFIEAVESGRVPRGSVLIVESLDRITRTGLSDAMPLFLRLINGGVTVVTLADAKEYTKATIDANIGELMMSLVILSRANDESRMKSLRADAAHSARRKALVAGAAVKSWGVAPQWLELHEGKWTLRPDRAKAARMVFKLLAQGFSARDVGDKLLAAGFKPVRGKGIWSSRTVELIARNRAAVGELVLRGRDGAPVVLPRHYPPLVTEEQWTAANAAYSNPARKPGRRNDLNVFRGFIFDSAGHSCTLNVIRRGRTTRARFRAYVPETGRYVLTGWTIDRLKPLVLSSLEMATHAAVRQAPRPDDTREAITRDLAEADARIANLVQAITNGYSAALDAALRQWEAERAELQTRLTAASIANGGAAPTYQHIPEGEPAKLAAHLRATLSRVVLMDRQTVRVEMRAGYSYTVSQDEAGNVSMHQPPRT
jgi:DNA invertase Pin-like site-specific DNA recombinase